MKNPLSGCVRKPKDIHPLATSPLLMVVGILKIAGQGTQLLHPFVKHSSRALCQKAAQGWQSVFDLKLDPTVKQEVQEKIFVGKNKTTKQKSQQQHYRIIT